jgi:hypothetical protein
MIDGTTAIGASQMRAKSMRANLGDTAKWAAPPRSGP